MKPRSDSKLDSLTEDQQAQLAEWLLGNMSLRVVKAQLLKEFNVAISISGISAYYSKICSAELIARRQRAVSTAGEIAKEAESRPGQFDAATIDALKQKAFELSIAPGADPRDVKNLFMLVLKARDQELDVQQLSLDRDKFQFDAARAAMKCLPELRAIANDKSLSDADKLTQARLKLFGDLPA